MLSKMSKENLEMLSYAKIAELYLKENKKPMNTADLFKEVCKLLELSDEEYQERIGDFFESLTTSKEFILLNDGNWDLRANHSVKIDIESLRSNQISLKEEFRDSISADKTSTLFDDIENKGNEKKSLNDRLVKNTIQVGLNDRIAFVNHLFNFNQQDFNRVLSQLNTFKTEYEAKDFINNNVKPDYDWTGKEEYQERLITLIERKFS